MRWRAILCYKPLSKGINFMDEIQHLDGTPLSPEEQRLVKEALDDLSAGVIAGLAGTIGQPVSQEEQGFLEEKLAALAAGIFTGLAGTFGQPVPKVVPPTVAEWLLATKRHPDNVFGRQLMASMLRAHRVPGCRGFPAPYREDRRQFVAHVKSLKAKLV